MEACSGQFCRTCSSAVVDRPVFTSMAVRAAAMASADLTPGRWAIASAMYSSVTTICMGLAV